MRHQPTKGFLNTLCLARVSKTLHLPWLRFAQRRSQRSPKTHPNHHSRQLSICHRPPTSPFTLVSSNPSAQPRTLFTEPTHFTQPKFRQCTANLLNNSVLASQSASAALSP